LKLPVAVFGAYAAGHGQSALETSVLPPQWPVNLCAPLMVAGVLVPGPLKAEPAVPLQRLFTGMKLVKLGGS
jgi:hypothetical protein